MLTAWFVFWVNLRVRTLQKYLSKFRKFENNVKSFLKESEEVYVYSVSMFLIMTATFFLLTIVMRLDLGWFVPLEYAAKILGNLRNVPVTTFNDFTKIWYLKVALGMMIARMIDIFFPSPFLNNYRAYKHLSFLKKIQEGKVKESMTQFELNQKLETKPVDFGFLIARVNLAMLLAMIFGSGIPLLIPITFLFFWALYVTTKKYFIRYSKKPAYMDESLVLFWLKVASVSNIFHFLNGLVVYSQETIFSKDNQYNFFGKENFIFLF